MQDPAIGGPSRSWDPSVAVEGEEASLCQGMGIGKSGEDNTLTSNVPMRLLPIQPIINAGRLRSCLDAELAGEYSSRPQG